MAGQITLAVVRACVGFLYGTRHWSLRVYPCGLVAVALTLAIGDSIWDRIASAAIVSICGALIAIHYTPDRNVLSGIVVGVLASSLPFDVRLDIANSIVHPNSFTDLRAMLGSFVFLAPMLGACGGGIGGAIACASGLRPGDERPAWTILDLAEVATTYVAWLLVLFVAVIRSDLAIELASTAALLISIIIFFWLPRVVPTLWAAGQTEWRDAVQAMSVKTEAAANTAVREILRELPAAIGAVSGTALALYFGRTMFKLGSAPLIIAGAVVGEVIKEVIVAKRFTMRALCAGIVAVLATLVEIFLARR
ncbi:MAG TPA: hypothetical protein VMY37_26090 [Thermoguttaceae bacterium]|nr:hypothetical protein [Thermoguttaceae bacterium]